MTVQFDFLPKKTHIAAVPTTLVGAPGCIDVDSFVLAVRHD